MKTYASGNPVYQDLLEAHERFHTIAGKIAQTLQKPNIEKQELEETNTLIK